MPTPSTVDERHTEPVTAPFGSLISKIRGIVDAESSPKRIGEAVAQILQPYLELPDLLTPAQCEADPLRYRQQILHVEPDGRFSVAALVWLPGQATPIHDHVSWCVVGVYRGNEEETHYELRGLEISDLHLHAVSRQRNLAGSVAALIPPGDLHQVANGGDALAISLHVYGADLGLLGCSIRRQYDFPVR